MENNNFHNNGKILIKATRIKGEPSVGPDAIMVAIPSELRSLVEMSRAEPAPLTSSNTFKLFLISREDDLPLALAGPFLGAPQGVIVMEKLRALGAKRIWVLGWCGSLQPDLSIGDIIIPTSALSEEGTSAHYPISTRKKQTNPLLNERLGDALTKANLPFKKGRIWTTDALYRETAEKVINYGKKGILACEMEMSALISVALYRSLQVAGLLIVSDELFTLRWRPGFGSAILKKRTRDASRVLLDICMGQGF
jgi:uridine phosphorylase